MNIVPKVPPEYTNETKLYFSASGTHFEIIGFNAGKATASHKPLITYIKKIKCLFCAFEVNTFLQT